MIEAVRQTRRQVVQRAIELSMAQNRKLSRVQFEEIVPDGILGDDRRWLIMAWQGRLWEKHSNVLLSAMLPYTTRKQ